MTDTQTPTTNGAHPVAAAKPSKAEARAARLAAQAVKEAERAAKLAALPETQRNLELATKALDDAEETQQAKVAAEVKAHKAYLDAKKARQEADAKVTEAEAAKATARTAHRDWTLKQATAKGDEQGKVA